MKKIIIIFSIAFSSFASAQQSSENPYVNNESADSSAEDTFPGNPADPNTAPIDQYIPILVLAGVVITFAYGRTKKGNYIL